VLDHICDPLRTESLYRVPEFRVRRSYLPIPQAHCNYRTSDDEKGDKMDLLIQFHTLIVLFLCWPVGVDRVVEKDNEMESLTSDVIGLEGEPLQSSARPKDIASLNVAR